MSTGGVSRRQVWKGAIVGVTAPVLVAGAYAVGAYTGYRIVGGIAGIAFAVAAAIYIVRCQSERWLAAAVVLTSLPLAWWVPAATAEAVLAERGVRRTVVVTEVHVHRYEDRDYTQKSCDVEIEDGTPVRAEVWQSCTLSTELGDRLSMTFDPEGIFDATDRDLPDSTVASVWGPAQLILLTGVVVFVAVIRSKL